MYKMCCMFATPPLPVFAQQEGGGGGGVHLMLLIPLPHSQWCQLLSCTHTIDRGKVLSSIYAHTHLHPTPISLPTLEAPGSPLSWPTFTLQLPPPPPLPGVTVSQCLHPSSPAYSAVGGDRPVLCSEYNTEATTTFV